MTRRILVIGAGGISKRHLRGLTETGRAELAIAEPDAAKRQAMAAAWNVETTYATADEAPLAAFDGALICAPAHVHIPLTRLCLEAGVPVLLEKPLSVTWAGVQELLALQVSTGVEVRVAYVRRSDPVLEAARARLLAGDIGELRLCHVNSSQEFPKYRPDYRETYYARAEMGGGALLDAASHWIDAMQWTVGRITEVGCMYDHLQLPGVTVEDTALMSLRFAGGQMGQLMINQFQKPAIDQAEWVGTAGNLRQSRDGALAVARDDSDQWLRQDLSDGLSPDDTNARRFRRQASYFLDLLDGEEVHLTTLKEAADNLHTVLAAKAAYREKRIITLAEWDPIKDSHDA